MIVFELIKESKVFRMDASVSRAVAWFSGVIPENLVL
jgi:hypothetical protein